VSDVAVLSPTSDDVEKILPLLGGLAARLGGKKLLQGAAGKLGGLGGKLSGLLAGGDKSPMGTAWDAMKTVNDQKNQAQMASQQMANETRSLARQNSSTGTTMGA
jgi:hypothetical protein